MVAHKALWWLIGCGLLLSCKQGERDPLERGIRKVEGMLSRTVDAAGLEAATQKALELRELGPDDPRLLGLLAELYAIQAEIAPDPGAETWRTAREFGLACLMTNPAFAGQVSAAGGKVTGNAVAQLTELELDCAGWTAYAWSRWALARGPGVSLDFQPLQTLSKQVVKLGGARWEYGRALETQALAGVLVPSVLGGHPDQALIELNKLAGEKPDEWRYELDSLEYGAQPPDPARLEALLQRSPAGTGPRFLRNQAVIEQARRMSGGPNAEG
jgi:hypothetical protein